VLANSKAVSRASYFCMEWPKRPSTIIHLWPKVIRDLHGIFLTIKLIPGLKEDYNSQ